MLVALLLEGCVITIDAMGCQKSIARKIISKKADYILSVKENQKDLYEDIQDSFRILPASDYSVDIDYGHGRIETRKCTIITDLSLVEDADKWKELVSIIKIERERHFKATAKKENETSYYINTLNESLLISYGVRKHWVIDNNVHWILDVAFNEDMSRKRKGNAAQNYSNLNRIALDILKKDDSKVGIKSRNKMAGWSKDYLLKLIRN